MNEEIKTNIVQAIKYIEKVDVTPGSTDCRNLDVALSILLETLEL